MKILCFYTNEDVLKRFKGEFSEMVFFRGTVQDLAKADFEKFKDIEIITSFVSSIFSKEIIDKFPNLKIIATRSTGTDHIDKEYCQEKGIEIKNVPDYGSHTVAEHVFALLLALSKKVFYSYEKVGEDMSFSRMGMEEIRGFDLANKTIGIVGTGKIGKNVIKIAQGFQMKILAYDIYPDQDFTKDFTFDYVDFGELLEKSDIISINVPLCDDTFHMFDFQQFEKMKDQIIIINTARGEIIKTKALYQTLQNKKIKAAGLDVLEQEHCFGREERAENSRCDEEIKKMNQELIKMPNVVVTPHNAFNTVEALERIYQKTIENIKEFNA